MPDLNDMTKPELLELAKEQDLEGRSSMTKDELIAALSEGEPIELTQQMIVKLQELDLDDDVPESDAHRIAASHVLADAESADAPAPAPAAADDAGAGSNITDR